MKIKILNGLLIVDMLTILFVMVVAFIPVTELRIVLGIPLLFYFPGYALVSALFVKRGKTGAVERMALCLGISVAVLVLLGFALNYTAWGIRLETLLYSISIFIVVFSAIALIRRAIAAPGGVFFAEYVIKLPGWEGNTLNKSFSVILLIAVLSAFGVLGYTVAVPKNGEKYAEFYMLGFNGEAQDYPATYIMQDGLIAQVIYNSGIIDTTGRAGKVTAGIVNHEQRQVDYMLRVTINGVPVNIESGDAITSELGPVELLQGEKWEQEIGIIPQHEGNNQKVEVSLFEGTNANPIDTLYLWINVK